MDNIIVTEHAFIRFKERANIKSKSRAQRMAEMAYERGTALKRMSELNIVKYYYNGMLFLFVHCKKDKRMFIMLITLYKYDRSYEIFENIKRKRSVRDFRIFSEM